MEPFPETLSDFISSLGQYPENRPVLVLTPEQIGVASYTSPCDSIAPNFYVELTPVELEVDRELDIITDLKRQIEELKNEADITRCKICLDRLVEIRLPCGHVYCVICLKQIKKRPFERIPRCSLCNKPFYLGHALKDGKIFFC